MRVLPPLASAAARWLALALSTLALPAARAGAPTQYEFWPEINAYVGLTERSRLLFTAAATRAMEASTDQRDLAIQDAQFSANIDYTLAPILRRDVPVAEWSKNRLLWARLGFEYGTSGNSGPDAFRSYTGIVELNSRFPMQGSTWLTGRLRADFRDVNGEPSQRYRVRIGSEWEESWDGHPFSPYTSIEALYDTRYEQWSRLALKAGLETPIGGDWRVEPYVVLQLNRPDDDWSRVLALGLTFKVYFD